jgi:hypothetical protein
MKAQEILEQMAQLNEYGQPYVGILYIIDSEVEFDGEHPRLLTAIDGGYHRTHSQFWYQTLSRFSPTVKEIINKIDKGGKKISWKYLPRGCVFCSAENVDFVVYCDKHIAENYSIKSKVRMVMNLPFKTNFEIDGSHYKCHMCTPHQFGE